MKTEFTEKDLLTRGVEEVIEEKNLKKKLKKGKKLRIKFGIDPTAPDIHLGHTVPMWKLRQFQDMGHTAVLIIGDYTASIGDPSGKDKTRPPLTEKEIKKNYKTYEKQALKILRKDRLEVHKQTEWFKKFNLKELIKLTSQISVGQLLSHETFRARLRKNEPLSTHELLYPFLQGYDSVAIKADVELGAVEQKFNLLAGRIIQKQNNMNPQDVITTPYLLGTDGKEKMSKSLGNYIALQDKPEDMFGKVMSITDDEIIKYFELATPLPTKEIKKLKKEKITGKTARNLKIKLAELITTIYWGEEEAKKARKRFETQFQKQEIPKDVKEFKTNKKKVTDVLDKTDLTSSKSEARRLIKQGAVYINDKRVEDIHAEIPKKPFILRVGRRKIIKVSKK
ncbi:MAG: tyrosine--tRNA ligase [Candidatus Spechtbacterales bacterium]|nr:tyrosine--tRNA ligase [Candidatus Spechtbacterales bacterium]